MKKQKWTLIALIIIAIGFSIAIYLLIQENRSLRSESATKAVQSETTAEINASKASNQTAVDQSASDVQKAVKWQKKGNDVRPVAKEVDSVILKWFRFE